MLHKQDIEDIQKGIPRTDEEAWVKYPKLCWVYQTGRLLDYQKVTWYPFEIDGLTNTSLSKTSIGTNILPSNDDIFIEQQLTLSDQRNKFDLVVHKGISVDIICYTEDAAGNVTLSEDKNGGPELIANSILAWHFSKFCGIVSFEYSGDILLAVRLKPHAKAKEFYPDHVLRNLKNLYNRRRWPATKLSVT